MSVIISIPLALHSSLIEPQADLRAADTFIQLLWFLGLAVPADACIPSNDV